MRVRSEHTLLSDNRLIEELCTASPAVSVRKVVKLAFWMVPGQSRQSFGTESTVTLLV